MLYFYLLPVVFILPAKAWCSIFLSNFGTIHQNDLETDPKVNNEPNRKKMVKNGKDLDGLQTTILTKFKVNFFRCANRGTTSLTASNNIHRLRVCCPVTILVRDT